MVGQTQQTSVAAKKITKVEIKLLYFLLSLFLLLPACDSREPSVMVYTWPGGRGDAVVALPQDKVREYINSCDIILRVTCDDEFDLSPDIETKLTRRYRVQSVVKGDVAPGDILWEDYYLEYTPQEIRERFGIEPQQLPCKKSERYTEPAWLFLRSSFVHRHSPHDWELDRSDEAYCYPYFLYGREMDELMEELSLLPQPR